MNKKLFIGTVPTNNKLFIGTVPTNSKLFIGTVPTNKLLFVGTVPMNKKLFIGTRGNRIRYDVSYYHLYMSGCVFACICLSVSAYVYV